MTSKLRRLCVASAAAAVLALGVLETAPPEGALPAVRAQDSTVLPDGQANVHVAVMPAAERATLPGSLQPPARSPGRIAEMLAWQAQTHRPGVMGRQDPAIAAPAPGTETRGVERDASLPPNAPGDFVILQSRALNPASGALPSIDINEPSLAQEGGYVFYTGNWYAARSRCGGNDYGFPAACDGGSWIYVDPEADMPDFCCDQDTIHDPHRQIQLWYRQGKFNHPSGPPNQNRFRLGVSYDAFGPLGSCFYNIQPTNLDPTFAGTGFDYPHLALSNDFLWISTKMYTGAGAFARQVFLKMPLDALVTCAGFNFSWFDGNIAGTGGWAAPVQGATTQMYFGGHQGTNNNFQVLWWNEDSNTVFWVNRAIPAFTFQSGNSNCTARPAGTNDWTRRGDSRMLAGWVRQIHPTHPATPGETVGQLGWMWNANEGGSFPQPYIEAVTLRQDDLAVDGRPLIWNADNCFAYPFASPNAVDALGVTFSYSNAATHVSTAFTLDDDYNGVPPGWLHFTLRFGGGGPASAVWGDYVRNRPNYPQGRMWVSSGHTVQPGGVEPRYYVVGRQRDQYSFWRYVWSVWLGK